MNQLVLCQKDSLFQQNYFGGWEIPNPGNPKKPQGWSLILWCILNIVRGRMFAEFVVQNASGGESAKPIDCGAWAGIMGSDWVINMPWDL